MARAATRTPAPDELAQAYREIKERLKKYRPKPEYVIQMDEKGPFLSVKGVLTEARIRYTDDSYSIFTAEIPGYYSSTEQNTSDAEIDRHIKEDIPELLGEDEEVEVTDAGDINIL